MFTPSLSHVLASAQGACRYEAIITQGSIHITTSGRDDHELAMEMASHAMQNGWTSSYPKRSSDASPRMVPAPPPPPPNEELPVERVERGRDFDGVQVTQNDITKPTAQILIEPCPEKIPLTLASEPSGFDAFGIPLISKRGELYRSGIKTHGAATATEGESKFALDLLVDLIGDKPVNLVTPDDISKFQKAISQWPSHIGRRKDFKEMKKSDVIKRAKSEKLKVIDLTTQGRHMKTINTFFNACLRSGQINFNPCASVEMRNFAPKIPKKKSRFSEEDLVALFNPEIAKLATNPLLYWGTMISFFANMRINEVAQMYVDDVQFMEFTQGGVKRRIDYFNVSDTGEGQHLKSAYSVRGAPIHSRLLEIGFLQYVEDVKKSGAKHLFPGLSWYDQRPSKVLVNWFNNVHKKVNCGINDPRKTLHCFRHTINTLYDRSLMPKGISRTLNGHSDGSDIGDRHYVTRGTLTECKDFVEKIEFPAFDLLPYEQGRFDEYLNNSVVYDNHIANLVAEGKPLPKRMRGPNHLAKKSGNRKNKVKGLSDREDVNLGVGPDAQGLMQATPNPVT